VRLVLSTLCMNVPSSQGKENKKGENYYIGVIKFILDPGI